MSAKYTLYDLPSREPNKCWSYNPYKTRLLLNYKNIPYDTVWLEYPDIKPTFENEMPPNTQGMAYTIPTIKLPNGSYMQDSRKIAERIEKDHPHPSVQLNSEYLKKVEALLPKIQSATGPDYLPKIPKRLLGEKSIAYWVRTREERFGMSLDQLEQEQGGDTAWMEGAPRLREMTALLKENDSGPFFEGNRVTYADFVWAGYLRFLQRIGDDVFDKAMEVSGDQEVQRAFYKACAPWLERDSH